MTNHVKYQQGQTTVWSDGEKVVITNPSGKKYIEQNVDQIFDLGEFQKMYGVKISEHITPGKVNPLAKSVEIVTNYIPEKIKEDLKAEKNLPGIKESDLVDKHFQKEETI